MGDRFFFREMNRTVEMSELEKHKENMVPIKQGRKQSALENLVKSSDTINPKSILQQQQEFLDKISMQIDSQVEDPIAIHLEYIRWMEQSFPSGIKQIYPIIQNGISLFSYR